MRLLVLSPGVHVEGGAERSGILLVRHLIDAGHEVRVLGVSGSALAGYGATGADTAAFQTTTSGLRSVRHSSAAGFAIEASRALPHVARAAAAVAYHAWHYRPDVVYSNGARTHLLTVPVPTPGAVVWALRDVPPRRAQTKLLQQASRRAALLLANSSFTLQHYRVPRANAAVVGNPVTPIVRTDQLGARRRLGLPPDRRIVALVAHLHPSKGHHIALDALSRWTQSERPVLAVAGGRNYPGSKQYLAELMTTAVQLRLQSDVVFLGSLKEVDLLYSAADILLHPAVHPEGFGRTVVEAQSAGVPVVASRLGGVAEVCRDQVDALLVPPGDADAAYRAMAAILNSETLKRALATAGAESARRYDPAEHGRRVEALLYEVVTA